MFSQGPWIDESISCHSTELSKTDYVDNILPNNFDYNILYELSDNTLLVRGYHKE